MDEKLKEMVDEYLKKIDASETVIEKVEMLIKDSSNLKMGEIKKIFIEENNASLQLITENYILEFNDFLRSDKMIIFGYRNSVQYVEIFPSNYNLSTCTKDSELTIKVMYNNSVFSSLSAKGDNCGYLFEIVNDILLPNYRTVLK